MPVVTAGRSGSLGLAFVGNQGLATGGDDKDSILADATEALIADKPEEAGAAPAMPDMGGMM